MPEYLAPGVYIEEVSFRAKTIEGVSTSTAGFVGPARYGPVDGEPELLTSFAEFERIYGGLDQPAFDGRTEAMHNYLAHAVRSFFYEGGKRLYVSRVYKPLKEPYPPTDTEPATQSADGRWSDGHARVSRSAGGRRAVRLRARYPGSGGNVEVTFTARIGQNVLAGEPLDPANPSGPRAPVLRGVVPSDLLWIADVTSPIQSPPGGGALYWAERYFDDQAHRWTWRFHPDTGSPLDLSALTPGDRPDEGDQVRVVMVNVDVTYPGRFRRSEQWGNLAFHPSHERSLSRVFGAELANRLQALTVPFVFEPESDQMEGPEIAYTLLAGPRPPEEEQRLLELLKRLTPGNIPRDLSIVGVLANDKLGDPYRRFTVRLDGGNDGQRPEAGEYEGHDDDDPRRKSGLKAFENIADISILAAPGSSFEADTPRYRADGSQILRHVIAHCERMRYRIAVLDSADSQAISQVRAYRGQLDSTHGALYYPWVRILDPVTEQEINVPPSGFVAGIYARNDVEKGVHKAPANEVVLQAIGLEVFLNKAQQDVLNPEGVNCFRFFEGRGYRVWGARTITSDPEWKYVNLRRYFAYLERSIERGTQWVVFENNFEPVWANVRRTVEDFLFNEWKSGHLMGEKPQEAYFVRCDRSTMTQNDIDNGRLICLIGVAPVRPAEFVIFRIGQWTADRRA
jgi:phage tail sheath protein FI